MRAMVTGATGFLGSSLVKTLKSRGYTVTTFIRDTKKFEELAIPADRIIKGDLLDRDSLKRASSDQDVVFHTAGMVVDWGKREDFFKANVEATKNLLDCCIEGGVKKFVHASSLTVLGIPKGEDRLDETAPYTDNFFEPYTETKIEAEKLVMDYQRKNRIDICVIRPGLIWGPGDTTILPRLERFSEKGLVFNIGNGQNIMCLSYIYNVCDAMILGAESSRANGEVYNIKDDQEVTSKQFFSAISTALGFKKPSFSIPFSVLLAAAYFFEFTGKLFHIKKTPVLTRYGLYLLGGNYSIDSSKAKSQLGYKQGTTFEKGVEELAKWYFNKNSSLVTNCKNGDMR